MTPTTGERVVKKIDLTKAELVVVRQAVPASDEQLLAAGQYSKVWSNILTSCGFELGEPVVGERKMLVIRAEHFPLEGNISGREGVEIMRDHGFRPPTLREFLTFGAYDLPGKWLGKNGHERCDEWVGSTSKWYYMIAANLYHRVPHQDWYDCAPAMWSHSGRRGLTVTSMYNAMMHAWPRNPHYLWVSNT